MNADTVPQSIVLDALEVHVAHLYPLLAEYDRDRNITASPQFSAMQWSIDDQISEAIRAVAQGSTPIVSDVDPTLVYELQAASESAFMHGLYTTMWAGTIASLIGVLVSIGIRRGRPTASTASIHRAGHSG